MRAVIRGIYICFSEAPGFFSGPCHRSNYEPGTHKAVLFDFSPEPPANFIKELFAVACKAGIAECHIFDFITVAAAYPDQFPGQHPFAYILPVGTFFYSGFMCLKRVVSDPVI